MQKKIIALSIKVCGIIALAMWFYMGYLYDVFRTYPTTPNPDTGNIIPFLWKTQNVYISVSEKLEYNVLFYGALTLFGLAAFTYAWAQKKFKDPSVFPEPTFRSTPGPIQKRATLAIGILVVVLILYSFWRQRFG